MGYDYYSILQIPRTASLSDVKKAYRRLALKYNPAKGAGDYKLEAIFTLIGEAYEVLSTAKLRSIYDQYGEEGLKKGHITPNEYLHPFMYHGEAHRTYREFFGTDDPYADLLDLGATKNTVFSSPGAGGIKVKDKTIIRPLPLTLNEVYTGCLKKMKIQRLVFSNIQCSELQLKEKILSITIEPGMYPNTEIRFKEEGDHGPTKIPADVVFVTEDRPHPLFTRTNYSDLLMTKQVTLREAFCGVTLDILTLDERKLIIPIIDVIYPTYTKVVEKEGLPIPKCAKKRGNLIIKFELIYIKYLSSHVKALLDEAFTLAEKEAKEFEEDN